MLHLESRFKLNMGIADASPRDAWPEQLFWTHHAAAFAIRDPFQHNGPVDFRVFVQSPYTEDNRTAPNYDHEHDVWLYTTGIDDVVYELPRRGRWHPNSTLPDPNLFLKQFVMSVFIAASQYFRLADVRSVSSWTTQIFIW